MTRSTTSSAALPQCAQASGASVCASTSRCPGRALRPVRFGAAFGRGGSAGFTGACGRDSNACIASSATTGGAADGRGGGVFRCLRPAMTTSSATRSLRRATCSTSSRIATWLCPSSSRRRAFSSSSSASVTMSRRDHAERAVSIPYRPTPFEARRYQPRLAAVKSMPASKDANIEPSI